MSTVVAVAHDAHVAVKQAVNYWRLPPLDDTLVKARIIVVCLNDDVDDECGAAEHGMKSFVLFTRCLKFDR